MARKGKYEEWLKEESLLRIGAWARDGLTLEDIAHNMGIAVSTLCEWKSKYAEISEALKNGKEVADIRVENALYKRALGYDYEEVITEIDDNNGTKKKHIRKVTKHVAPDVTAQIFWLKNRKPDKWRDRQEVINSIEDLTPLAELLK